MLLRSIERRLVELASWDLEEPSIYMAWGRGRRIPLLKTLLSSCCKNSCYYCAIRRERRVARGGWNPERLVRVTLELWKRGVIKGFFLSSGMFGDPERVVELQVEVARRLRERGYTGYINLRLMPGTPRWLVWEAAEIADRIGVNLESLSRDVFYDIAPDKGDYLGDLLDVLREAAAARDVLRREGALRAGIATQVIVGLGETDREVIEGTFSLLREVRPARVYYSPFTPVPDTPLEGHPPCSRARARRLYQAFFLMRDYGFTPEDFECLLDDGDMLASVDDLKEAYAKANRDEYPVDLNSASLKEMLRVPGIGPRIARELLRIRSERRVRPEDVRRLAGPARARKILRYVSF